LGWETSASAGSCNLSAAINRPLSVGIFLIELRKMKNENPSNLLILRMFLLRGVEFVVSVKLRVII
jgi:hypothetical protein